MEYRTLGKSGLKISEIGLGTNNFGGRVDEPGSIAIINKALELGINFIDTAEMYNQGNSETAVGKAVKGKHAEVIIATKFAYLPGSGPHNEVGASRHYIMKAVDASLKRLNMDYIDLYYSHKPDPTTPIEETLRALDDLVKAGKVRYIGCSNYSAWQLSEALWTSKFHNLNRFIAVQSRYNLLDRNIEPELVPCCQTHGVGVIPWGPLAGGFLTGKYCRGQAIPPGVRFANPAFTNPASIYGDVITDVNFDKLAKLEAFAREHNRSVGEVAIAWLLSRTWMGSVITGAMNTEQLSANVATADRKLTAEEAAELDQLT